MTDALRGSRDAAEYKHGVLGLIFLKSISDAFEEQHRKLGRMVDRTHRELTDEDIAKIANTYHTWRTVGPHPASGHPLPVGEGRGEGNPGMAAYADIPGFCKSATLDDIRKHGHVLTPGRYVGAEAKDDDGKPFEAKMTRLVAELREQQAEAAKLDAAIRQEPEGAGLFMKSSLTTEENPPHSKRTVEHGEF